MWLNSYSGRDGFGYGAVTRRVKLFDRRDRCRVSYIGMKLMLSCLHT